MPLHTAERIVELAALAHAAAMAVFAGEDLRFLRGRGIYVDDLQVAGLLYAVILRSAANCSDETRPISRTCSGLMPTRGRDVTPSRVTEDPANAMGGKVEAVSTSATLPLSPRLAAK